MTPTQDAAELVRWADAYNTLIFTRMRNILLRGALRIVIAHGSRKVRVEAAVLLRRIP